MSKTPTDITKELLDQPPRPGVGMMVVNNDKKVFVGKRVKIQDQYWQMPQGGIDGSESPENAAKRELNEEIGCAIDQIEIIAVSKSWHTYNIPEEYQKRHFKSQTQKWFLVHFHGTDADIDIHQKRPEFSEWQWIDYRKLTKMVVDFKKDVYKQVIKDFAWYFDEEED